MVGDAPTLTPPRILIAGLSTRAMAASAVHAGHTVMAIDAFGDLDHHASPALSLRRDFGVAYTARALATASRTLHCDAVAYTSTLENHPHAVALLARNRTLLGNPPSVLRRARDAVTLAHILRSHRFPALRVRTTPPTRPERASPPASPHWLTKPRASGGGHGIAPWHDGSRLATGRILQEHVDGPVGSLAFAATGNEAVPFTLSRQLVGDRAFGATGTFTYCGNILAAHGPVATAMRASLDILTDIANTLTHELALTGVNGIDFVLHRGTPFIIEVNPRHSASMELIERATGFSVFDAHLASCAGVAPRFELDPALRTSGATGKAILYARHTMIVGDTHPWLEDASVRDVPHPGERIPRGRPICTIFAHGRDEHACYAALVRRAARLYATIEQRARRTA